MIEYENRKISFRGTQIIKRNNFKIQGHMTEADLGELKQLNIILPMIIKDNKVHFESLKDIDMSAIDVPIYRRIGLEFHMSITNIVISTLIIIICCLLYLKYKRNQNSKNKPTESKIDEDVFQLRQGGVI